MEINFFLFRDTTPLPLNISKKKLIMSLLYISWPQGRIYKGVKTAIAPDPPIIEAPDPLYAKYNNEKNSFC